MAALLFVTLEEILDNVYEDTYMLLNNDDSRDIDIFAAVSAFMRRSLKRNQNFYEEIISLYSLDEFRCHFRMSRGTVELLCREIAGTRRIPLGNRFGRAAIPLEKQVLTFMWFISNTEVMRSVSDRFNVTLSSLERILFRVSGACVDLKQQYIKWPSENEMHTIMNTFANRGFPRVIGVIDGTHIRIKAPTKDPVAYINRKKFHSLNTQVVCDDSMIFRDVLVGWPGSVHDSRILRNSSLYATASTKFPGDTHLIGDGGYPLKCWLITPFRNNGYLNDRERQFNYKLSSVRSIVERSIRFLKGRWRKLASLDHIDMELLVQLIMCACVLHNFCIIHDDFDNGYFLDDHDESDCDEAGGYQHAARDPNNMAAEAKRQRLMNLICYYLVLLDYYHAN